MASSSVSNTFHKGTRGERPRDLNPTNQYRDQSPHSFEADLHLQQQQPHQPMYRKREAKAGEKEKRVLKKTPQSPSSRKKHGTNSKNHNIPPKNDHSKTNSNSSNKTNQSKNNTKKKTKKQHNKAKKKKSKLAFWFCMSSNTDSQDRSSQAPIVAKPPKSKPSIEQNKDSLDRDTTLEIPTEILATKYSRRNASKRHSAPPSSEWTRIVTTAIVESPSQPPRSRTPTGGVRYRYDGTLERPYVYPGGLTFQSGGDKSWRHDAKRLDGRNNNSFCDTTLEDGSQLAQCDKDDNFDITSKFYLRFDYDPTENSRLDDRRFSMPPDFSVGDHKQLDQKLHSPTPESGQSYSFAGSIHEDNHTQDQNVIYDIPYESDSDKEDENHEDPEGKRDSYYSKPLQNSGCIYMWHSCEDLQHCEEKYHSKDGLNRICESCKGNTPPRCHKDIHTGYDNGGDHISVSSSPMTSVGPDSDVISYARKMSLPVELTLQYPLSNSPQKLVNSDQRATVACDNTPRNRETMEEMDRVEATSDSSQYTAKERGNPKLPDQSQQSDSPFRRDTGRSSCMPGNKRFFIPPPPCYTPPKEEMEVALTTISRVSCHRGSQTDLTEDAEEVNMEDRDLSLKRSENQSLDAMKAQMVRLSLDAEISTPAGTDKHQTEDKREHDFKFPQETSNPFVVSQALNNAQGSLTNTEPNHITKPAISVRTSTPKACRKSGQQDGDLKVFSGPKPLPRKRVPTKDSMSPVSTGEGDAFQLTKIDSSNQELESLSNTVVVRTNKVPPVPRKRRSQMVESDLTYTSADIEKVLAECKDDTLPRGVRDPSDINIKNSDSRQYSPNTGDADERQTIESKASGIRRGLFNPSSSQPPSTPSKDQNQANMSPEHRCHLNSSLGSSLDGGHPPRRFTALSPSLDNMVGVFQKMSYDPDDEDNCNADDEMSIHNEDIFPPGSASVHHLLRSRSIFDRSLAVTRKRRQRLRDRKCHSQLLSSGDIDEYDNKMSKSHLWKPQKWDDHVNRRLPGFPLPSGDKHFLKTQLLMGKNLWKHSYTDSGNDSDMLSPIDIRDHRHVEDVFPEAYPAPEIWKKSENGDGVKEIPEQKPWEVRLRVKHELRKARSIEHLFLAQDARTMKKPSLETCV